MTDNLYPSLTDAEIVRIAAHGRRRAVEAGETLVEVGDPDVHFYLVVSGAIDVFRVTSAGREELVVTYYRGQFTAEANMLTGRRGPGRARVERVGRGLAAIGIRRYRCNRRRRRDDDET